MFQFCNKKTSPNINLDCETGTKNVLIEDFTGHACPFCPDAAFKARELQEMCTDKIIVMSVHAGYFAGTKDFGPDFSYDFTTEAGHDLDSYFNVNNYPAGMINRTDGGSGVLIGQDKWKETIAAQLKLSAEVTINISASFNKSNEVLTTTVSGEFLSAISGKYSLVVCLTENGIIQPQKNNNPEIGDVPVDYNYVHQHVLRSGINGSWGQEIASGNISSGQTYNESYKQDFNGHDWEVKHANVVAYVYRNSDKTILQVEQETIQIEETVNRKVLIENYTGHGCVNCPGAAVVARELQELYEDELIIMDVHAGFFASTDFFGPNYTYDFNTEAGTTWNDYYSIVGNPKGMVNRIDGGLGVVTVPDKWGMKVVDQLETPADVKLSISNSFNPTENKLSTTVSGHFTSTLNGNFKLVVCITENNIVKPQKNNDPAIGDVPDEMNYEHMHVLRIAINGPWGQEIASGGVTAGTDFSKSLSQDFTGHDWVPENCHVVAFISQDSDKSILQVEEAAVVE